MATSVRQPAAVAMAEKRAAANSDLAHQLELCKRALIDSERGRSEALLENQRLHRSKAELVRLNVRVAQGFEVLDEQSQGRLRQVVEEACDELTAFVDRLVEGRTGEA